MEFHKCNFVTDNALPAKNYLLENSEEPLIFLVIKNSKLFVIICIYAAFPPYLDAFGPFDRNVIGT